MKEKVIRELAFPVKPFRSVRIGDPMYFEMMAEESGNKDLEKITCHFPKIPFTSRCAGVRIRENAYDLSEEGMPGIVFNEIELMFYSAKRTDLGEQIVSAELNGEYMPSLLKRKYTLGCDTARFELEVDGNYDEFRTLSDGEYGYVHHYKNNDAFIFSVALSDDAISFEEMARYADYFFKKIAEKNT